MGRDVQGRLRGRAVAVEVHHRLLCEGAGELLHAGEQLLKTETSPFVLAGVAFVLALTSPAIVAVAAKAGASAGTATAVAAPLIALAILFAFAFHIRFALGALRAERRSTSIVATFAMLLGVTGFIGSVLVLMGILR